jgi:copper chaperone CopZ
MVCSLCVQGIKKSFLAEPEVESVNLSLDDKNLTVVTKTNQNLSDERVRALLKDSGGYEAVNITRSP